MMKNVHATAPPAFARLRATRLSREPNHGATHGLRAVAVAVLGLAAATVIGVASAPALAASSEMDVLTQQGISPARAEQALAVQGRVAETELVRRIERVLADAYAGVWFEPAAAKFHVGVTSDASGQAVTRLVARAGLTADVVVTTVRSTWNELIAAQNEWNRRLARLFANADVTTAIDPERNAVSVTLSSSVSSSERAAIIDGAEKARANILVSTASSPKLRLVSEATCEARFTASRAFCERTLVAGVGISIEGQVQPTCTAGPMLIEGNETYMLTAGHCFGEERTVLNENFARVKVTSEYPAGGGAKEIGNEGTRYLDNVRDMAEVKILRPGSFSQALPTPVPALVTEWTESPRTPHAVEGVEAAILRQTICHEGMATGEQCGEVTALNITAENGEHLVETSACSAGGDSGGPYFTRAGGRLLMVGMHKGRPARTTPGCGEANPRTDFEPLLDLRGAAGFGILSTFAGQSLLTTANETRPRGLPDISITLCAPNCASSYPLHLNYLSNTVRTKLEAATGSVLSGEGLHVLYLIGELTALGTFRAIFLKVVKGTEKCFNQGVEANGEVLTEGSFHIVYTSLAGSTQGLQLGVLYLIKELTGTTEISCPTSATNVKVRGSMIGALNLKGTAESSQLTGISSVLKGSLGKQSFRAYWNDAGTGLLAKLESNVSGTGFKESSQVVEGEPEATALEGKMFVITNR
jgi:hypothetical protein